MLVKCLVLLFCYKLLLGGAESELAPVIYTTDSTSQCGQYDATQDEDLMTALQQIRNRLPTKQIQSTSCKSIHNSNQLAPSGYYQIQTANGSVAQVYCDMEGTHCGGEGGWTRVIYINMTQAGATCPQGLEQMSFNGSLYCGRFSSGPGCVSALLNTTISYQQVCGQVAGYQENGPDAFRQYIQTSTNINQLYFDGLSILHGSPRNHVWTYAAGFSEDQTDSASCPCNTGSTNQVPPYVGSDYYCESGNNGGCFNVVLPDVLWDGEQCDGLEAPCCTHPNMPWFIKTLNETTTDNIELRACTTNSGCDGTVPVFLIEIYVR